MKLTERDRTFERRLERELRLHAAFAQQYRLRTARPRYRPAAGRGMKAPEIRWGIMGKAAAGLIAVALALGGGAAAAMSATGSANPIDVGQRMVQVVEGCKDSAQATKCVGDTTGHPQNGEAQQHQGANPHARPGSSPDQDRDHGQGSGGSSAGDHGQVNPEDGNGNGAGQEDHDHKPPHIPGS